MKDPFMPLDLQEVEHSLEGSTRVEHQVLVVHLQAAVGTDLRALGEHALHRPVPLGQAVPVAGQVEAGDGDPARDHGVHGSPAVP